MGIDDPYVASEQEIALRNWVRLALTKYDAEHPKGAVPVIPTHQRASRPVKPYATIHIATEDYIGMPAMVLSDSVGVGGDYEGYIEQHFRGIVNVTIFGDKHSQMMRSVKMSLRRPEVRAQNKRDKCFVVQPLEHRMDPTLRESSWDYMSQCDFIFAFAEREDIEAEGLESIVGTVDADGVTAPFEAP